VETSAAELTWLGHATVMVELDGVRILTDPVIRSRLGPLVNRAASAGGTALEAIDLVLLSHLHHDHADARSLRRLGPETPVITARGAARWLRRQGFLNVRELTPGSTTDVGRISISAITATHDGRRYPLPRPAPAPDAVGFVIRGSRTVYFAGDTDLFAGMADLTGHVDVALLPVGGWGPGLGPGHLDPQRAAEAARLIEPRIAIPIHWGTLALPRLLRWRTPHDAAGPRFADFCARLAPAVEVRVLVPGEPTTVS
jgi:L-ascorbate metabolism protein UlaG (beta-lactamase superfamily)